LTEDEMKKLIGGAAFAVMASGALVNLGPTPAHANEATSCVWTPEEGAGEYPEGTVKEEFWGTETRPDGSVVHRYRLWRCSHGTWWYEGDKYYPAQPDSDDDDGWGDGGHREILT
jgi:hypothetical protein